MMYAVDTKTKKHRLWRQGEPLGLDECIKDADSDGWIEWAGSSECPLPDNQPCEVTDKRGDVTSYKRPELQINWLAVKDYRPILDPQAEQVKGWRGPEPGERARTSGGDCIVLAIDIERGKVAVQWVDGELGVVNAECVKSHAADRERWIEAADNVGRAMPDGDIKLLYAALYDAGLARLPD